MKCWFTYLLAAGVGFCDSRTFLWGVHKIGLDRPKACCTQGAFSGFVLCWGYTPSEFFVNVTGSKLFLNLHLSLVLVCPILLSPVALKHLANWSLFCFRVKFLPGRHPCASVYICKRYSSCPQNVFCVSALPIWYQALHESHSLALVSYTRRRLLRLIPLSSWCSVAFTGDIVASSM